MTASFPTSVPTTSNLRGDLTDNTTTFLSTGITAVVTTIPVDDTSDFPSAGLATLKKVSGLGVAEVFSYTGKTANSFTGVTRNFNGKGADSYAEDDEVHLYWVADHHNRHAEETIAIADNIRDRFGLNSDIVIPNGIGKVFTGDTHLKSPSVGVNTVLTVEDNAGSSPWTLQFTDATGLLELQAAGSYSFQVDATRVVFNVGSATDPTVTFDGDFNTGIYHPAAEQIGFTNNGAQTLLITPSVAVFAGNVRHIDGTAALPAMTFSNDIDTGIYLIGTNNMGFSTTGVVRWSVDSSGRLVSNNGQSIHGGSGTAGAPSFSFSGDPDSGLFSVAANSIGLATAGVVKITIDSGGTTTFVEGIRAKTGSAAAPSYTFSGDTNTGIYSHTSDSIGFSCNATTIGEFRKTGGTNQLRVGPVANAGGAVNVQVLNDSNTAGSTAVFSAGVGGTSSGDPSINWFVGGPTRAYAMGIDVSDSQTFKLDSGTGVPALGSNTLFAMTSSGLARFTGGGAASPSIARTTDTNTGIYWVSADRLGITAAGSNVASFRGADVEFNTLIRPAADNTHTNGTAALRWSDLRSVLINGADYGFMNGWFIREYPATFKDIQEQNEEWFKDNANVGLQFVNDAGDLVMVLGRDGTVYAKEFKSLSDLDATVRSKNISSLAVKEFEAKRRKEIREGKQKEIVNG